MSYTFEGLAPQGWQCPICHRVYSPSTPMCWYCGNGLSTTSTSTDIPATKDNNEKWKNVHRMEEMEEKKTEDIRDIAGLWCDDITFCQEECEVLGCPRNQHNIRDRSIPHSYSVEIPLDCPKKEGERGE